MQECGSSKILILPLPAHLEVLCFRVRFRTFEIFCFRFQLRIELVAYKFASASNLFHQSASASTKTSLLPPLLLPASASISLLIIKQLFVFSVKRKASLLCKLFYLTCVVDSESLFLLLHFTSTVVPSLKIRKRLILKKLLPLSAPFQYFCFQVCFRFQPLSSKCFCFRRRKKLTASASTSLV